MDAKIPVFVLSTFNFCLYGVRAILGGHIINGLVEGDNRGDAQSVVTDDFLLLTNIVCMVGVAASLFGFIHLHEWSHASRMVALGLGVLAVTMELLVTGYASKQWQLDAMSAVEDLEGRLYFMGIATVVEAFTMMLFVAVLLFLPNGKKEEGDAAELTDEHHEDEHVEKNSA